MLEINKKEDIIIPFDNIGDNNWEVKTKLIIDAIAENSYKKTVAPVAADKIDALEKRLGTTLPEGLKTFYTTFGIAEIGEELQSFENIVWIKDIWSGHSYGPDFTEEDKAFLPFLISFSDNLGSGDMFCFHSETKEIYFYRHEENPYITRMFDKVDDYIKGCLIFAQYQFPGQADEDQIQEWAKEIVGDMVSEEIVEKWYY